MFLKPHSNKKQNKISGTFAVKFKTMYFELIFNSFAVDDLTSQDIIKILIQSREFSSKHSISGCLLYHNKEFLQILEGDEKVILDFFEVLCKDKRHSHVTLIHQERVEKKIFPNWSMAFKELSDEDMTKLHNYINLHEFNNLMSTIEKPTTAKQLFGFISQSILKD